MLTRSLDALESNLIMTEKKWLMKDAAIAKGQAAKSFRHNGFQQYVIRFSSNSLSDRWIASCNTKSDCDLVWEHLIRMCDLQTNAITSKHHTRLPTVLFEKRTCMDGRKINEWGAIIVHRHKCLLYH